MVYNDDISKLDVWPGGLLETTTQGPGELFQNVIKDQFLRIRDGDWFWFENSENGVFTEDEIAIIHNTTLKHVIVENTRINASDIQDNVFINSLNDVTSPCYFEPLRAEEMENCTEWETYDYFSGSEGSYIAVFVGIGVFIVSLFGLMYVLAWRRQTVISHRMKTPQTPKGPSSCSDDIVHGVQTIRVVELKSEQGDRPVLIFIRTQPYKEILITDDSSRKLRTINLNRVEEVTLQQAVDDPTLLILRVPRSHDFIMRYSTRESRDFFSRHLKRQMEETGTVVNVEDMSRKELMAKAITKRRRQKLVAEFLREVFAHASDERQGTVDEAKLKRRVLNCQLTKDEFADSLSLKSDSLFVDQMFRLADTDGDGTVTFREFFNLIVVFTRGTADEKLHLMFELYDTQHSGRLERDSFKEMFVAMMEMVNASVDPNSLNELCDSMFTSAGLHQKDYLTFEDFCHLLHGHKDALADLNLNLQVPCHGSPHAKRKKKSLTTSSSPSRSASKLRHAQSEPGISPTKKSMTEECSRGMSTVSLPDSHEESVTGLSGGERSESSANRHGSLEGLHLNLSPPVTSSNVYRYRLNVARAYFSPMDEQPPSTLPVPAVGEEVMTQLQFGTIRKDSSANLTETTSWLDRKSHGLFTFVENYRRQIFFLVLYHLVVLAIFVERAYCKANMQVLFSSVVTADLVCCNCRLLF